MRTDDLLAIVNHPNHQLNVDVQMAEIAGDWLTTFSDNPDLVAQLIAELCRVNPKALAQAMLNLKYIG